MRLITLEVEAVESFRNGRVMPLDSDIGSVRPDRGMATFSGNVVITTADGMRVTTDVLNTALDEIRGDAPGTVRGTGPFGSLPKWRAVSRSWLIPGVESRI